MNWKVFVASLLLPAIALADPLPTPQVVTYPPGEDKIVVVHKGDAAPFTGQLYDDATALRWAVWLRQYRDRYGIDLQAEQESCKVRLEQTKALGAVDVAAAKDSAADLRTRLQASEAARLKAEEELRNPPFFSRPGTWFGVGVVATIAISVSTAFLIERASR